MADNQLFKGENGAVTFWLAHPLAFADIENPTVDDFEDAENNGLIWNITCALDESGTEFTLGDPETDDSVSFCQAAGTEEPTYDNPEVVFQAFRSKDPNDDNTASLAFELMAWPDLEYIAIKRVGPEPSDPIAAGDRISLVGVKNDNPVDVAGADENIRIQQNYLPTGDVAWNRTVVAS